MLQWPSYNPLVYYLAFCFVTFVNPVHHDQDSNDRVVLPAFVKSKYKCTFDANQPASHNATHVNYRLPPSREKRDVDEVYRPIRIKPFIGDLDPPMEPQEVERIQNVVESAISVITKLFKVYPVQGPLVFSRSDIACGLQYLHGVNMNKCAAKSRTYTGEECFDGFMIPDDHLEGLLLWSETGTEPNEVVYPDGAGLVDTDIVLYLKAEHTDACNSQQIFAYAATCQLDQFNRPIAGLINFCPNYLKDGFYDEKEFILVALHEIFHILGFSQNLFDKFQECSICAEGLLCEDKGDIVIEDTSGQSRLHSPAVLLAAQKQWGCLDTNIGVPLENVNGGSSSSHWESQVMLGSLMAPVLSEPRMTFLDEITLSVFEDSGWYKVNYEYAEDYPWGKGQGCEFTYADYCLTDEDYFCNSSTSGCHYLHEDIATCASDDYLDVCNVFKSQEWCNTLNVTGGMNETAKCFLSNVFNSTDYLPEFRGQCYLTRCSNNSSQYEIKVDSSDWTDCPPGNSVTVPGCAGEVHCPPADVICREQTSILNILNNSTTYIPTTSSLIPFTTPASEIPTTITIYFNFTDKVADHLLAEMAFISSICQLIPVSRSSVEISDIYLDQGIFQFSLVNLTSQEIILHVAMLESAVNNKTFHLNYQNLSFTAYGFSISPHLWTQEQSPVAGTSAANITQDGSQSKRPIYFALVTVGSALSLVVLASAMLVLKMVKRQAMVSPLPMMSIDVESVCTPRAQAKDPRDACLETPRENATTYI